jgi:hypothetical protein
MSLFVCSPKNIFEIKYSIFYEKFFELFQNTMSAESAVMRDSPQSTSEENQLTSSSENVSPTKPTAHLNTTDLQIRMLILELSEKVETLEHIIKGDCSLGVKGIQHLNQPEQAKTWEDRLQHLLFEANIPRSWYLDFVPGEEPDETKNPNITIAYIYFINHTTKTESIKRLNAFIHNNYSTLVGTFG